MCLVLSYGYTVGLAPHLPHSSQKTFFLTDRISDNLTLTILLECSGSALHLQLLLELLYLALQRFLFFAVALPLLKILILYTHSKVWSQVFCRCFPIFLLTMDFSPSAVSLTEPLCCSLFSMYKSNPS